jgi:hypothetical protein
VGLAGTRSDRGGKGTFVRCDWMKLTAPVARRCSNGINTVMRWEFEGLIHRLNSGRNRVGM